MVTFNPTLPEYAATLDKAQDAIELSIFIDEYGFVYFRWGPGDDTDQQQNMGHVDITADIASLSITFEGQQGQALTIDWITVEKGQPWNLPQQPPDE